jgi:DNA-binding NarL/FixJ family response regulator
MGFAAPPVSAWRSSLAEALVAAGEPERARSLAETQLEIAERTNSPRAVGEAQRALALSCEADDRIRLLEESVATLRSSPARIELARSLIRLGAEIARQKRRREAREPLTEAMKLAQECGATWIEEQARTGLVSTGARPRRRALSGAESLTPSELRVAGLVASGMTNREAAQALFVSEKTIEGHLGRIFRKLEITSRTELAAQLGR